MCASFTCKRGRRDARRPHAYRTTASAMCTRTMHAGRRASRASGPPSNGTAHLRRLVYWNCIVDRIRDATESVSRPYSLDSAREFAAFRESFCKAARARARTRGSRQDRTAVTRPSARNRMQDCRRNKFSQNFGNDCREFDEKTKEG